MKLILVGDDGSKDAAHALEWATRLAEERSARLVAVHVIGTGGSDRSDQADERIVRVAVRDRHPASAIMEVAEERGADLIILGRRGSGGFRSLPIGTTAHHVAAASGRPVPVVPPVGTTGSGELVQRAVVGLDGHPGSQVAATWSSRQWPKAHFTAVQAVELAPAIAQLDEGVDAEIYERARTRAVALLRERWSRPLVEAGVGFDLVVADGGAAEVLLDTARKVEANLVVVGRRDHYPLRGTLGGVSQRMLAYAPCAAVIVPSENL